MEKVFKRKKIALIGGGNIGGSIAYQLALEGIGDVVIVDIMGDVAVGKALDIQQGSAAVGVDVRVEGSDEYRAIAGADVVIVTAGVARREGMSREDLLSINRKVMLEVGKEIGAYAKEAFVICITNPLDVMVGVLQRASGLETCKVVGMAGVLDSARFATFLSQALEVSVREVFALVLGGHGDLMVPLVRFTTVCGVGLPVWIERGDLSAETLLGIIERTREGGLEIVRLLQKGSAYYAPAVAAVEMAKAVLFHRRRMMPVAAFCRGEYGVQGAYVGVPVILGGGGVEKIVELPLNEKEQEEFRASYESVASLVEQCDRLESS